MNMAKKQYNKFTNYIKSNKNTILLLIALILCSIIIIYLYQYSLNNNKYNRINHIEGFSNDDKKLKLKSILKDIRKEKLEKLKNNKNNTSSKLKKYNKKVKFELNKNKTKIIPANNKNRKVKPEKFTDSNNIRKNQKNIHDDENYEHFEDGLDEDGIHYSDQIKNWGYKSFNTTPYKYGTPEYYEYKKKRERDLESFNNTSKSESNHYKLTRSSNKQKQEQTAKHTKNKINDDEKFFNVSAKDIQKKIFSGSNNDNNNNDTDNFQNVMDEIDNVDLDAFSFNSIGNTLGRYSDNIKNRLKNAADTNPYSPLDKTMAQGSILYDEFKKLFVIKNVF
jgi:hypothetical protein